MASQRPLSPYPGMPEDDHALLLETTYAKAAGKIRRGLMKGSGVAVTITRMTPQVSAALSTVWNDKAKLVKAHHDPDDLAGFINQCFSCGPEGRPVMPAHAHPQRFEMALWANQQLCAIASGREIDTMYAQGIQQPVRTVWVTYVAGAPEPHPFKGKTLHAVHEVASTYAKLAKASHVLYLGPLSPGSIEQVEKGAIPVNPKTRLGMWNGMSIHAPVEISAADRPYLFQSNNDNPPAHIATVNAGVYQKLFKRPYGK